MKNKTERKIERIGVVVLICGFFSSLVMATVNSPFLELGFYLTMVGLVLVCVANLEEFRKASEYMKGGRKW